MKKHEERILSKVGMLFKNVPSILRNQIGGLLIQEPLLKSTNLPKELRQGLEKYDLIEAYQSKTNEIPNTSIPANVAAAQKFIDLCKVEMSLDSSPLHEVAQFYMVSGKASLESWLTSIEEKLKLEPLESIVSSTHDFIGPHNVKFESEAIQKGRDLISQGRDLESYSKSFGYISAQPSGPGWEMLTILARYRPSALSSFLSRIHDPIARIYLKLNIENNKWPYHLGIELIRSMKRPAICMGLEICLNRLERISFLYAKSTPNSLNKRHQINARRAATLTGLYSNLWSEIERSKLVTEGIDLLRVARNFKVQLHHSNPTFNNDIIGISLSEFFNLGGRLISKDNSLLRSLFTLPEHHGVTFELSIRWLGTFALSKSSSKHSDKEIGDLLKELMDLFFSELQKPENQFRFLLNNQQSLNTINAWVDLFRGGVSFFDQDTITQKFEFIFKRLKQQLVNRWHASSIPYGTEDALTYACVVYLYSSTLTSQYQASTIHHVLHVLEGIRPKQSSARGSWQAILNTLEGHLEDPKVVSFTENSFLRDGISPDFLAVIPLVFFVQNPSWKKRATELVSNYANYFSELIDQFKEQLKERGLT